MDSGHGYTILWERTECQCAFKNGLNGKFYVNCLIAFKKKKHGDWASWKIGTSGSARITYLWK